MMKYKILAIDDEINNLYIIETFLEDETQYELITAADGVEGWEIVENSYEEIDLILLDRMMPNMNGMQFMEKINSHPLARNIPVIMQTAAIENNQIAEGIKAGVYYYLTKPFDRDIFVSLIGAALNDFDDRRSVLNELKNYRSEIRIHRKCLDLTARSQWQFKTMDEYNDLSISIAFLYPDPGRVIQGISELLLNAIEHGNLGIGYHRKSQLQEKNRWIAEINKRLALAENREKTIFVDYEHNDTNIVLSIKDQGRGFDWSTYMEIDPRRVTHTHGRGIALANMFSFDKMEYVGCGNEVICTVDIRPLQSKA